MDLSYFLSLVITLILISLFAALLGAVFGWAVDFLLSRLMLSKTQDVVVFLGIELLAVVVGLVGAKFFLWLLSLIGLVSENLKFSLG